MLSLGIPKTVYIDHSSNINHLLTQNEISYDLLHGTRSSTLKSMYADGTSADIKGALLSKKEAENQGVKPGSGNFKANINGDSTNFEDPVTKGEYVSTASKDNANLAHFYATDPSFNTNSENYPIIFAIRQGNLEIKEFDVGIPQYSEREQTDFAVRKMVPRESIAAVLVPKEHLDEVLLGRNISAFGYDF